MAGSDGDDRDDISKDGQIYPATWEDEDLEALFSFSPPKSGIDGGFCAAGDGEMPGKPFGCRQAPEQGLFSFPPGIGGVFWAGGDCAMPGKPYGCRPAAQRQPSGASTFKGSKGKAPELTAKGLQRSGASTSKGSKRKAPEQGEASELTAEELKKMKKKETDSRSRNKKKEETENMKQTIHQLTSKFDNLKGKYETLQEEHEKTLQSLESVMAWVKGMVHSLHQQACVNGRELQGEKILYQYGGIIAPQMEEGVSTKFSDEGKGKKHANDLPPPEYLLQLHKFSAGESSHSQSSASDGTQFSVEKCIAELCKLKGVTTAAWIKADKKFKYCTSRAIFLSMPEEERMEWLLSD